MLCTGVLVDKPDVDWEPVIVLQMLAAPWGVIVVRGKDWDATPVDEEELILLGSEVRRAKQREHAMDYDELYKEIERFTP